MGVQQGRATREAEEKNLLMQLEDLNQADLDRLAEITKIEATSEGRMQLLEREIEARAEAAAAEAASRGGLSPRDQLAIRDAIRETYSDPLRQGALRAEFAAVENRRREQAGGRALRERDFKSPTMEAAFYQWLDGKMRSEADRMAREMVGREGIPPDAFTVTRSE
jgi:hypothetical protein